MVQLWDVAVIPKDDDNSGIFQAQDVHKGINGSDISSFLPKKDEKVIHQVRSHGQLFQPFFGRRPSVATTDALVLFLVSYTMLTRPNKAKTSVHGS